MCEDADRLNRFVAAMGRLLTLAEERQGKRRGYSEHRWVDDEAGQIRQSMKDHLCRRAEGDDAEIELYVRRGTDRQMNVAVIWMHGEREQAMSWQDWDDGGVMAAEELYERLITEGLDVEEVPVSVPV